MELANFSLIFFFLSYIPLKEKNHQKKKEKEKITGFGSLNK